MATSQSTVDFILDQLVREGRARARKMFGEYALYFDDKVVGLVCNNTLYIKITEQGREFVGKYYKEGYAYPGARASMEIDGGLIEDREWLYELVNITSENVPFPKPKKPGKRKSSK